MQTAGHERHKRDLAARDSGTGSAQEGVAETGAAPSAAQMALAEAAVILEKTAEALSGLGQHGLAVTLLGDAKRARAALGARDLASVMAALYASEINCGMASFWDAGWAVWLGDDMNGRRAEEQFSREEFSEIAEWLHTEALHVYPDSDYAKRHKAGAGVAGLPDRVIAGGTPISSRKAEGI